MEAPPLSCSRKRLTILEKKMNQQRASRQGVAMGDSGDFHAGTNNVESGKENQALGKE